MGLLSGIFGSSSVESRLEAEYTPILQATMAVSARGFDFSLPTLVSALKSLLSSKTWDQS